MRGSVALLLGALLALPCGARAQERPSEEDATTTEEAEAAPEAAAPAWPPGVPEPPIYETWWFWTSIAAVVVGVTLAIVIGVTTDHPRSSRAGLVLAF
jgi:hypothetical protein